MEEKKVRKSVAFFLALVGFTTIMLLADSVWDPSVWASGIVFAGFIYVLFIFTTTPEEDEDKKPRVDGG